MYVCFDARLGEMLNAYRTLYESKGLEFNDVSSPRVGSEAITIALSRFYFTISLRILVSMSLSGESSSTRLTVLGARRFLLQLSMKTAMQGFALRFVAPAWFRYATKFFLSLSSCMSLLREPERISG